MQQIFKRLAEPVRIGPLMANNRIWLSPVWTRYSSVEGEVTGRIIDHYVACAKGGAGLITQESTGVDGRHIWLEPQLRIDEDRFGPGLYRLVEAVHMHNVPIIVQLHHAGMFGTDPVSPSGVACFALGTGHYIQPRVLSLAEIEEIRDRFIAAAVRAKEVGYDGVELHGATAYVLEQFVSPYNNKRTDKYGGALENRMLLPLEIVRGIRQQCGPDYPLGYTLVDDDLLPGGIKIEEAMAFAKALEADGVSYVDLQTTGTYETFHFERAGGICLRNKRGQFDLTEKFKKELTVPITTRSSGQFDPVVWEEAFKKGAADAVRAARPFLADPEMAIKVLEGRVEDIRPCIMDKFCYESGAIKKWSLTCTVNPELGKSAYKIQRAPISKKVLVVGGGPGGLEAARVAALRGHAVTLMEKEAALGGNLTVGSLPIAKEELRLFIDWAEGQCKKLGVTIELNKEVTSETVEAFKPDAVIVATGSRPFIPPIPGIDRDHVVTAEDVLTGKVPVGKKVIVAGGGEVGLETADFIIEKGLARDVTMVEMLPMIAQDMNPIEMGFMLMNVVPKIGLKVVTEMCIREITDKGLVGMDKKWQKHEYEADTVVLAMGYAADNGLFQELKGKVGELYIIGDAVKARRAVNAIHEGAYFAQEI